MFLEILKYSTALERMIRSGVHLRPGCPEEIEIRLYTVLAIGKLLEEINKERHHLGKEEINMAHLDYRLWSAGRESKEPHHLTATLDY